MLSGSHEFQVNPVKFTKTCKIPQTVLEILPNTCCHNIFETSNISKLTLAVGGCLLALELQIGQVNKMGNGHNVKSFAIGAFLKCIVVKIANRLIFLL